jgi:hypothetical protein
MGSVSHNVLTYAGNQRMVWQKQLESATLRWQTPSVENQAEFRLGADAGNTAFPRDGLDAVINLNLARWHKNPPLRGPFNAENSGNDHSVSAGF